MNPVRIYDYLNIARGRVFDAVRPLTREDFLREFSLGLNSIAATLTHLMVSEWYYVERLEGRSVPPYQHWPIKYEQPPEVFDDLEHMWRVQADRIRASIAAERDWGRKITWLGFPDDTRGNKRFHITCTAGDLLTQLVLHEVHHRAQVMVMLRKLGKPLEDLDFNALMFDRREAT
jgi:uncharacterized damage-inducible protein DinB